MLTKTMLDFDCLGVVIAHCDFECWMNMSRTCSYFRKLIKSPYILQRAVTMVKQGRSRYAAEKLSLDDQVLLELCYHDAWKVLPLAIAARSGPCPIVVLEKCIAVVCQSSSMTSNTKRKVLAALCPDTPRLNSALLPTAIRAIRADDRIGLRGVMSVWMNEFDKKKLWLEAARQEKVDIACYLEYQGARPELGFNLIRQYGEEGRSKTIWHLLRLGGDLKALKDTPIYERVLHRVFLRCLNAINLGSLNFEPKPRPTPLMRKILNLDTHIGGVPNDDLTELNALLRYGRTKTTFGATLLRMASKPEFIQKIGKHDLILRFLWERKAVDDFQAMLAAVNADNERSVIFLLSSRLYDDRLLKRVLAASETRNKTAYYIHEVLWSRQPTEFLLSGTIWNYWTLLPLFMRMRNRRRFP